MIPAALALSAAAMAMAPEDMPPVLPCTPPLDRALRLVVTQYVWMPDGTPATVTATRSLHFVQDASGLAVEARLTGVETDQRDPEVRARLLAGYGLPGRPPLRVRFDALMGIASIDRLEDQWRDFVARQAALRRTLAMEHKSTARADAVARQLDALPMAGRIAILTSFLSPLLRFCGAMVPADATFAPDGGIAIATRTGDDSMRDAGTYSIDPRTGLLRRLERHITVASAPLRPLRELWTLAAETP